MSVNLQYRNCLVLLLPKNNYIIVLAIIHRLLIHLSYLIATIINVLFVRRLHMVEYIYFDQFYIDPPTFHMFSDIDIYVRHSR